MTIKDVAQLAGYSVSAVSHTLNGRDDISARARERILDAARTLGWRPAAAATALAGSTTQTVGYVVQRSPERVRADPFVIDVFAGVQAALVEAHHNLLVRVVTTEHEELETYESLCQRRQVDGFVLTDHRHRDPRYPIIRASGLDAVALGRVADDCPFPVVAPDPSEPGITAALTRLAELGHRSIGYIGGPAAYVHSTFRRTCVERTSAELGLGLVVTTARYERVEVERAVRSLRTRSVPPTALVFSTDWMALQGMAVAEQMGLRVPDDLSVIGHDNAPFAELTRPRLASVSDDVLGLADAAARVLLATLRGSEVPTTTRHATRFIDRESVGPAPSSPTHAA